MDSSAIKTIKPAPTLQKKVGGYSFFRKVGGEGFFGTKEHTYFSARTVQPKLTVSTPDDPHEKEADDVAGKVMRMPDPVKISASENKEEKADRRKEDEVQAKMEAPIIHKIQCKSVPGKKLFAKLDANSKLVTKVHVDAKRGIAEKPAIQTIDRKNISLHRSDIMRESGRGPPTDSIPFEQTLSTSKGGGSPLPGDTRTFMESRFGADFGGVRIHDNPTAVGLTRSVNAQAFAHGNDIYFNSGKYSPDSTSGRGLLAHELTHTVQQGASKTISPKSVAAKNNLQRKSSGNIPRAAIQKKPSNVNSVPSYHTSVSGWGINVQGKLNKNNNQSSLNAGIAVQKKPEKEELQAKKDPTPLKAKTPAKEISLSPSPAPVKIVKSVAVIPIATPKIILKKTEESVPEAGKQSAEKETDIHLKHKSVTGYSNDIQSCSSSRNEKAEKIQAKHNQSENPLAVENRQPSTVNCQPSSERGPPTERGPPLVFRRTAPTVQRSVVDDALSYAGSITDCITTDIDEGIRCAKRTAQQVAMHIPGYKALRVVLGEDPISGETVARSGRNFIEAAFDIVPGGNLLHKKLDEIHKLDAAAAWIDEKIEIVTTLVRNLKNEIIGFWKGIGVLDIASPLDVLRKGVNIAMGFIGRVVDFAVNTAKDLLKMVKDFLLDKIVDFIKTQTTAYPLLTVILGKDPITDKQVERNGTNILNALLDLGGADGKEQKKQMMDTGTFKKAAGYIDEGIKVFSGAYDDIVNAFHNIWNVISIESLMDPVGTFTKIYNGFAEPVRKVWDFIKKVGAEILKFIKEVLMIRLSTWAKTVKGYPLVTVIIGKDPFTGAMVPRTVENIIHGFMSLMDGGEEQFTQMKESGAIAKAEQKINAAVKLLNMTPQAIIQLFVDLWNSFSIQDLIHPIAAFQRILAKFGEPIARLLAFVIEIIKIVVEVILIIMQFPFDVVNNIIAKAMQAYQKIKSDPVGFLKNLLRAIKEGFIQFFDNILKHLLAGLTGWLMSELKDANVKAPKDFTLGTIIGWVLDLLGISMEKIWEKLAKHPKIGPERVAKIRGMISKLEGIWTFIKDVQERGMAAIWDKIVEKLNNLWDTVLDAIKNWIMEQIVNKIVTKLLSMLDPTGIMAVVNSVIALYKAIQSFIKYLRQMLDIVNSFVEGVVEIANGNTKKAANFLEGTLAKAVPIVIGFLANQIGLGGVGKKVGEMIEKVRDMVDKALTWLVNKAVDTGFALFEKLFGGGKDGKKDDPSDVKVKARDRLNTLVTEQDSKEQIEGKVQQVFMEFKPQGLSEFKMITDPQNEGEYIIKGAASPPRDLIKYTSSIFKSPRSTTMQATIKHQPVDTKYIVKTEDKEFKDQSGKVIMKKLFVKDESLSYSEVLSRTKGKISKQFALIKTAGGILPIGGALLIPETNTETQLLTWNTAPNAMVKGSNSSHAEFQFRGWMMGRPKEFISKITGIEIQINNSPCDDCCATLRDVVNVDILPKGIEISEKELKQNLKIKWQTQYCKGFISSRQTTESGASILQQGGWEHPQLDDKCKEKLEKKNL